jgi:hypothetical protein
MRKEGTIGPMARNRVRKLTLWPYLLILVVGIVNLISYTDFSRGATAHAAAIPGDARYYIQMSQHTFAHVPNPYAFRLLSPLIVHELTKLPGLGLSSSWILLSFVATYLALIVFFKLLHSQFKLSLFTSMVFTLMLSCTYNYTLYNYGDIWLVDPLNNLFYVLGIYLLFARRLWWFAATIALGSINKETTILLAPLYPLLGWIRNRSWKARDTIRSAAVMAGVVAIYLAYHAALLAKLGPGAYTFGSGVNGTNVLDNVRFSLSSRKTTEQLAIFGVFQYLWFIFAYGLYRLYKERSWRSELLVTSAYVLCTIVLGRLFATDTQRVYVMMAPLVLGVSAMVLDWLRSEQQRLWMGTLAFLYLALNFGWISGDAGMAANLAAIVIFVLALRPAGLGNHKLAVAGAATS